MVQITFHFVFDCKSNRKQKNAQIFCTKSALFLVNSKKVSTFATRLRSLMSGYPLNEEKKEQNKIVQSNEKNIPTFSEKEKEQAWFP